MITSLFPSFSHMNIFLKDISIKALAAVFWLDKTVFFNKTVCSVDGKHVAKNNGSGRVFTWSLWVWSGEVNVSVAWTVIFSPSL